jgi:hypothetical protein
MVLTDSSLVVHMKKVINIAEFEVDIIRERSCLGDF